MENINENVNENTNENERFTLENAIEIVANNLGNISFPASVLAVLTPEQILMIKQTIINPVELARRNLMEILSAYQMAAQQVAQERENHEEQTNDEEVKEDGTETNVE